MCAARASGARVQIVANTARQRRIKAHSEKVAQQSGGGAEYEGEITDNPHLGRQTNNLDIIQSYARLALLHYSVGIDICERSLEIQSTVPCCQ